MGGAWNIKSSFHIAYDVFDQSGNVQVSGKSLVIPLKAMALQKTVKA